MDFIVYQERTGFLEQILSEGYGEGFWGCAGGDLRDAYRDLRL